MRTHVFNKLWRPGLAAMLLWLFSAAVAASSVAPVYVAGNPTCADLGIGNQIQFGDFGPGSHANSDGVTFNVADVSGGQLKTFDWNATFGGNPFGIDAVIVKAGNGANVYFYNPEASADTDLQTPDNGGDQQAALSHIRVCYDYEALVSKTADTSFDRRFEWSIDKSVSPSALNLFQGDSGDVNWTVAVSKSDPIDYNAKVFGAVTVSNPWPFAATVTGISDLLDGSDISAQLNCGAAGFPYTLGSGGTLSCSYSVNVSDTSARVNVATVTTTGQVGGGSATATATFGAPDHTSLDSVHVTDTNGQAWIYADDGSATYPATYACANLPGIHNVATITETQQSDSADVAIACYGLNVTKTAATTWSRAWNWSIAKAYVSPPLGIDTNGDNAPDALLMTDGESVALNYSVVLNAAKTDGNYQVSGNITVVNNNPVRAAELAGVIDSVSGAGAMGVSCPGLTVPAGGSMVCTYAGGLPDNAARVNTATATLQNHHYAGDGGFTASGTTPYTGSANVVFSGTPASESDECVNASDAFNGGLPSSLGNFCAGQAPVTLNYSAGFTWNGSVIGLCATVQVRNVASFATNDSGTVGSSTATINVSNQDCGGGCTLTPGYWKTHSGHGPARYDNTWAFIGEDSPFFLSGQSYYQVLWTSPSGNAYYVLAHAYIAAALNQFNGANVPPEVQQAIIDAEGYFAVWTPDAIGKLKGSKAPRPQMIALAALLDMYNNGEYPGAPPHCTE